MVQTPNINIAWKRLRVLSNWRVGVLPGLTLTGLIIVARLLGLLQLTEWKTLDFFLRVRPAESTDERITIVSIDETDIQALGSYPISDQALSDLLQKLDENKPQAVGIDIFRDLPQDPGHDNFVQTLAALPYVFGTEFLDAAIEITGPPSLTSDRIGFNDFLLDSDGFVRRSLLGRPNSQGEYRFSLAIRLAEHYLGQQQITLESGIQDADAMRFATAEIPPFRPHTGGYVGTDANSQQTLINVRSGATPFRKVSLQAVMDGTVPSEWINNKIILIGIVAPSHRDTVNTAALKGRNPGDVYGVEVHAHAVSQLISATLDARPLLQTWPDIGEYLWIVFWGGAGILLVGQVATPFRHFRIVIVAGIALMLLSYGALIGGWWIPIVPSLAAFLLNGLVLPGVLLYDQMLRSRVEEGQRVIRQTYSAMHNGPLQTLALLLRDVSADEKHAQLAPQLRLLNEEIRHLYDTLEQELEPQSNQLHLESGGSILNLDAPLHEVLYQVYSQTLQRSFPHFQGIKVHIVKFEKMQDQHLGVEDKRSLCRFLEEALCNVGRYASSATRLQVTCQSTAVENTILIEDNGKSAFAAESLGNKPIGYRGSGRGTQQARRLARQLKGKFERTMRSPYGVCCELSWPL